MYSFAFVTYEEKRDAEDAADGMDGKEIDGRVIKANIARPRPPRGAGGGGGGGGGFGGGDRGGEKLCHFIPSGVDTRVFLTGGGYDRGGGGGGYGITAQLY